MLVAWPRLLPVNGRREWVAVRAAAWRRPRGSPLLYNLLLKARDVRLSALLITQMGLSARRKAAGLYVVRDCMTSGRLLGIGSRRVLAIIALCFGVVAWTGLWDSGVAECWS